MSRKRRMFDIDVPSVAEVPEGKIPDGVLKRRSPMAAAISETAEHVRDRAEAEQAIRQENDRLAFELVRLRREGLVVERLPLADIHADKLIRDRVSKADPELEELKQSIRDVGLSNPIRVEPRGQGGYELVQGMRRLTAFRQLFDETGAEEYATIPAGILAPGAPLEDSYRRMVDENLVRKDISFAEMGRLARLYVEDPGNDCEDVDKAVKQLFKSVSYTKRSYIRAFASLLARLDKVLEFPDAIPRNVGVELKRKLDADPGLVGRVSSALNAMPDRDAVAEVGVLRRFAGSDDETLPVGKVPPSSKSQTRKPRTTFQVGQGGRVARCAASSGRLELKCDLDFSAMDRHQLEEAVRVFLATLERDAGSSD